MISMVLPTLSLGYLLPIPSGSVPLLSEIRYLSRLLWTWRSRTCLYPVQDREHIAHQRLQDHEPCDKLSISLLLRVNSPDKKGLQVHTVTVLTISAHRHGDSTEILALRKLFPGTQF